MVVVLTVAISTVTCARSLRPGDSGYAYNVSGVYTGRLVVQDERFDAQLELRTARGGSVRGAFRVSAPFEIEGRVSGAVVDDLLRLTIAYQNAARSECGGRVEGILTIAEGGGVVDGPVTVSDCDDALPGHMSFRR